MEKSRYEEIALTKLKNIYSPEEENLIVFFIPSVDIVNGGVLSIFSLYEESKKLIQVHGCNVLMCTLPYEAIILKYTHFKNNVPIFPFEIVAKYFTKLNKVIFHVPELYTWNFIRYMNDGYKSYLSNIRNLQINIMNQNINLMPDASVIRELKNLTMNITCTTAHEKYTTKEYSETLGIPLHKFSTFVSPEQYKIKSYQEKENILVVSPDEHHLKSSILNLIQEKFPSIKLIIIQNLSFEEYKEIISKAKWALTFGEGMDGYFIETVFSGGISFSVYNERFFTPDFKDLLTVYNNYEHLIEQICQDILKLDNLDSFSKYHAEQFNLLKGYYDYKVYVKNIENFYNEEYTFK